MSIEHLLILARNYAAQQSLSLATVSTYAAGDGKFFTRLETGRHSCTVRRFNQLVGWFDEHWPTDLEWPNQVARPSQLAAQEARHG